MYDLIIRGGTVIDGTGRAGFTADVAVRGDKIADIAPSIPQKSKKEIDLDKIQSLPMQKLFSGLCSPAVKWNDDILHFDWKEYDKNAASFVNIGKSRA